MRDRQSRLYLERLAITGHRTFRVAQPAEDHAQIEMDLGDTRIQGQHPPIARRRLGILPQDVLTVTKDVMNGERIRKGGQHRPRLRLCVCDLTALEKLVDRLQFGGAWLPVGPKVCVHARTTID